MGLGLDFSHEVVKLIEVEVKLGAVIWVAEVHQLVFAQLILVEGAVEAAVAATCNVIQILNVGGVATVAFIPVTVLVVGESVVIFVCIPVVTGALKHPFGVEMDGTAIEAATLHQRRVAVVGIKAVLGLKGLGAIRADSWAVHCATIGVHVDCNLSL